MNKNYNDEYIEYVRQIYNENSIIVDLNGSIQSGRKMFLQIFNKLPRVHLLCYNRTCEKYNDLTYSCCCTMDDYIELLNSDKKGTMIDYNNNVVIRKGNENDETIVQIIHDTIDNFILLLETKNLREKILLELNNVNDNHDNIKKLTYSRHFFTGVYKKYLSNK